MPPQVGVVESAPNGHNREHHEECCDHVAERKDALVPVWRNYRLLRFDCNGSRTHANSSLAGSESVETSCPAARRSRWRYAREICRLRAASVLLPLCSRTAATASLIL